MRRFEAEDRAVKPDDFDPWWEEIGMLADLEGECAVLGMILQYAPMECVRFLGAHQGLVAGLLARARYADQARYLEGVLLGRGVGL